MRRAWGDEFRALEDVTFKVDRGETLGIIGRNGSGKSTALKLIAGVTAPSSGKVFVTGRVSPLIELGAGFHADLTGRENVHLNGSILGMSQREIDEQFDAIVEFAELQDFIDTPVKRYSSGMYVRLGFAVAVHSNPEVLLIDEVLSVGDAFFQEKCLARMHQFQVAGTTIILVSHSAEMITNFCERAIWLDHGRLAADGPAGQVVDEYMATVPHAAEAG
ncbi:MAG: ABC transporter ATP-binding protein [Chloroflexi bacterium]|nr:MAG: ABC transporter ATP-binding protein [Chloroflexota bacterium]